ncbi:MAG: acetylglutamate kinase [Chloroflexi bacterium]|nr:acetylglutamate kinase [Chloroflexota bacterium]
MQVYKIGGNELSDPGFLAGLAGAVAALDEPAAIVHGGGKAIADLQAKLGLETVKVDGLRVTDAESLAAAEMVLSGYANKQIVKALLMAGVDAVGLSGVDGGLLRCQKKRHPTADLGFVGEIVEVRAELVAMLTARGMTAVISPISLGLDGQTYNVNADEAASAVALALEAEALHFISNVPGVIYKNDVMAELTPTQTEEFIARGVIRAGMVPKVRAALEAIGQGVPQARIGNLDGLLQGVGTVFTR